MNDVSGILSKDEVVQYEGEFHPIMYRSVFIFILLGIGSMLTGSFGFALFMGCMAIASGMLTKARIDKSILVITNKRVILQTGLLSKRSIETFLHKIESVKVIQGIGGSIFGYGTIIITGTGGTKEAFEKIKDPQSFRNGFNFERPE